MTYIVLLTNVIFLMMFSRFIDSTLLATVDVMIDILTLYKITICAYVLHSIELICDVYLIIRFLSKFRDCCLMGA